MGVTRHRRRSLHKQPPSINWCWKHIQVHIIGSGKAIHSTLSATALTIYFTQTNALDCALSCRYHIEKPNRSKTKRLEAIDSRRTSKAAHHLVCVYPAPLPHPLLLLTWRKSAIRNELWIPEVLDLRRASVGRAVFSLAHDTTTAQHRSNYLTCWEAQLRHKRTSTIIQSATVHSGSPLLIGFDTNNPDFSILNFCTARHKTVNSFAHRWTRGLISTNLTCLATTWGEVKMRTPARKRKHLHYVHHWTATNPGHRDDKSNGIQPCSINHAPAPSKIDQQSLSPGVG